MSYILKQPQRKFNLSKDLGFDFNHFYKGKILYSNGISFVSPIDPFIFDGHKSFLAEFIVKRSAFTAAWNFSTVIVQANLIEGASENAFVLGFLSLGAFSVFGVIIGELGNAQLALSPDEDVDEFAYYAVYFNADTGSISIYRNGVKLVDNQGSIDNQLEVIDDETLFTQILGSDRLSGSGLPLVIKPSWLDDLKIYVFDNSEVAGLDLDALILKRYRDGLFSYDVYRQDILKLGYHFDNDYNENKVFDCSRNLNHGIINKKSLETGGLKTIAISAGGLGYSVDDVLTLVQEGGIGGTATVLSIDEGGAVLEVEITDIGEGYTPENGLATTVIPEVGTGCLIDLTEIEIATDIEFQEGAIQFVNRVKKSLILKLV